jgi:hypothetical protein
MKACMKNCAWTAAVAACVLVWGANEAAAQNGGSGKPFESFYRRPPVSAYQQLSSFGNNPQAAGNLYHQMVMPLQQQQQQQMEALSQGRQINRLQNQVQQIQRGTSGRQIDETIRPTGHASTFQNLSHFYPSAR